MKLRVTIHQASLAISVGYVTTKFKFYPVMSKIQHVISMYMWFDATQLGGQLPFQNLAMFWVLRHLGHSIATSRKYTLKQCSFITQLTTPTAMWPCSHVRRRHQSKWYHKANSWLSQRVGKLRTNKYSISVLWNHSRFSWNYRYTCYSKYVNVTLL